MKKRFLFIHIVYIFLIACGSIFAIGESTVSFGGESTWRTAETRNNITEAASVRPYPVLVLSSAANRLYGYSAPSGVSGNYINLNEGSADLAISFDERQPGLYRDSAGNYRVTAHSGIEAVDRSRARSGAGAVLFGASDAVVSIEPQSRNALFSAGNRIGDFTIEFWLFPLNMENGERIVSWFSGIKNIQCYVSRNRLQWSFTDFFTSTNGSSHINIEFSGNVPVVPRVWSHHLLRFDAVTGMIEYLVDGVSEAICYATRSGRESGEVYTPIPARGSFLLGENFTGLIDEFKIHSMFANRVSFQRYPSGGRMETRPIDLGSAVNMVRVNVTGGRTGVLRNSVVNEFRNNGNFLFSDDSQAVFFIRACENPYLINNVRWTSFTPGADITGIRGRYVQIAADFYPSADGEVSPYLEQFQIVFLPSLAPLPPQNLTAIAVDGGVQLRWRHSPNNTSGYLVYYSSVRGDLFGEGAVCGPSPVDAGYVNSFMVEGLQNGTLYYFKVAAYERVTGDAQDNIGEFSAEATSRPLSGLQAGTQTRP